MPSADNTVMLAADGRSNESSGNRRGQLGRTHKGSGLVLSVPPDRHRVIEVGTVHGQREGRRGCGAGGRVQRRDLGLTADGEAHGA